jgi:hypothetical protein
MLTQNVKTPLSPQLQGTKLKMPEKLGAERGFYVSTSFHLQANLRGLSPRATATCQ